MSRQLTELPLPGRLLYLVLGALILVALATLNANAAPAFTEVGGDIDDDTTWSLAGSPYIVTSNIRILSTATLTIQPGVEVRFDSGRRLRVSGSIQAQGTSNNPIVFTSNLPNPRPGDWGNIVLTDTDLAAAEGDQRAPGSGAPASPDAANIDNVIQNCVIEYSGAANDGALRVSNVSLLLDGCHVRHNAKGGVRIYGTGGNSVILSDNWFYNNAFDDDGAAIWAIDSLLLDNVVLDNVAAGDGGGIHAVASTVTGNVMVGNLGARGGGLFAEDSLVTGNTMFRNFSTKQGSGAYFVGNENIQQNTFVQNRSAATGNIFGGVGINGDPNFTANNLYANWPYDLVVESSADINGENNFWGTSDAGAILNHIYDQFDDGARGLVDFSPFLNDADGSAPLPPPLNLTATLVGNTLNLDWDAIPGAVANYTFYVYYDSDQSGPPYTGTGLPAGSSPIAVGSATNYALSGVGGSPRYVAVTARDATQRESWFSIERDNLMRVYLPLVTITPP